MQQEKQDLTLLLLLSIFTLLPTLFLTLSHYTAATYRVGSSHSDRQHQPGTRRFDQDQPEECLSELDRPEWGDRVQKEKESITMSVFIIVIQVALGLLFVAIGTMTATGRKMFVENFQRFGYPQWFRVVTGSLEVLGGLGLLIGIWLPWLAELASAGLSLLMLGAVLTHVRTRESWQKIAFPFMVGALAVLVAISYWPMFLHLITRL